MKASELRLGNYYMFADYNSIVFRKVREIKTNQFGLIGDYDGVNFEICKPIELTEEWLIKFGFEKNIDYEQINEYGKLSESNGRRGVGLYLIDNSEWLITFREDVGCGWNDLNEINYVHQLQNIYFALTGDELNFNN